MQGACTIAHKVDTSHTSTLLHPWFSNIWSSFYFFTFFLRQIYVYLKTTYLKKFWFIFLKNIIDKS